MPSELEVKYASFTDEQLKEKDNQLFRKVVDAMQRHDSDSARILSNELASIRKELKRRQYAGKGMENKGMENKVN